MRLLSIDPGYDRIGIAIIEKGVETNQKEVLIFSKCFTTTRGDSISERVFSIAEELEKIIKEYQPEIFAIESVYFTNNQKTALGVAEAKGVFQYIAHRNNLKVYEYTPLQIKMAITGNGKASKDQVAIMVPKLIQINLADKASHAGGKSGGLDDEIDAIAVGLTCFACERF